METNHKKRKSNPPYDPPANRRARRFLLLLVVFNLCIGGLLFRIWYLQKEYGEEYAVEAARQAANRDRASVAQTFEPLRGGFLDRNRQPITATQKVYTIFLDVEALHNRHESRKRTHPNEDIRQAVFDELHEKLGIPMYELVALFALDEQGKLALREGRNHRVLKREVPADIANELTSKFLDVHSTEVSVRRYVDPLFAPQVIGFTRGDSTWGLELQYQNELRGEQGRNMWVMGNTETIPVRDGYTLVTTLDADIQRLAQEHVNKAYIKYVSQFVALLVMNPHTGEILAMAQAPTFSLDEPYNPEHFTDPILQEIWDDLTEAERTTQVMSLWRNYHTTRSNEPGSTFKPFVIAAAIEEGVISPHSTFHCTGGRQILDRVVTCWNTYGCGNLSLRRAIYRSCNVAMIDINRQLGRDLFYRYRGFFGFGEQTEIDFPGEEAVSSPLVMYPYSMLQPVQMATSAIGQGFNATTLQVINGYAALINGGNLMRPYLVSQIVDSNGNVVQENTPTVVRRVISQETSDFIRTELRYVINNRPGVSELTGTGYRAHIQGHDIAGKTGTAQQGERDGGEHIPTFVAYLPVENPQYLVLLTIDRIEGDDYYAGSTVGPLMREFLVDLIRERNIQPMGEGEATPEIFGTPMPDFAGQRLSEAVRTAINMGGGSYQAVGGGTIVSHTWPAAGQAMPENAPITFFTDPATRIPERMVSVPDVVGLRDETAHFVLTEAGLPTVLITDERTQTNQQEANPVTSNPEPLDENNPPAVATHTVYQQYPTAGSEIEQGTQVIIRAR
ncbi:MAG: penicillin-binding transpeptidase domain-containing protein [Defluviitaleaceae bacterium]|nr:penicillin-binding transpeptidase domain-containing protein [Defluviitaleaceae bacterium]